MIKFTGESDDNVRLIGLGLSRENCEKLVAGKPIEIDLRKDLNIPWRGRIVIIGGETEESMARDLTPWLTAETQMHPDERYVEFAEDLAQAALAPAELRELVLYAWVGPNDAPGATGDEWGIKIGVVPAGMIPLAAVDCAKMAKLWPQMAGLAKATGKPRYLARFHFAGIERVEGECPK